MLTNSQKDMRSTWAAPIFSYAISRTPENGWPTYSLWRFCKRMVWRIRGLSSCNQGLEDLSLWSTRRSEEVVIWRLLSHPNVVPLLGVLESLFPSQWCMVSEGMSQGMLRIMWIPILTCWRVLRGGLSTFIDPALCMEIWKALVFPSHAVST